ncbi:hypothetical protein [Rummeliibacillus stabekisii]|uniref:hypothetical protein n=1 Tax=Rummeliibacillus stabekisii TaxID=241244 RepID=UPI0011675E53|nr:hypothetical protein [Rummeliibacillus stabekisii]MBB5171507.1 hypothetical protein [Rummeliibacillus stabekisii]GEL05815.1 hypothetical protein RST01_24420 [Rummeliibacillus stabekisii]
MSSKALTGVLVALTSILAVIFIIRQNFDWAVLFISLMFTITNSFRAKDMARQGYTKEAKWMKGTAIFFGIATLVVLALILF